jgi:hypothetical protein
LRKEREMREEVFEEERRRRSVKSGVASALAASVSGGCDTLSRS